MASAVYENDPVVRAIFVGGATNSPQVELYVASTAQRDGVGGSFQEVAIEGMPRVFFASLTPAGADESGQCEAARC